MDITAAVHAYNRAKQEHAAGWEERCLLAAAPHLQFAPAQLPGDVIEGMLKEFDKKNYSRDGMAAAAQVLLERPEVLGPVTNEEWEKYLVRDGEPHMLAIDMATLIATRRDSLLKPAGPTLEAEICGILGQDLTQVELKSIADLITRRTSGGTKCDCHLRENQVCDVCQKSRMKESN